MYTLLQIMKNNFFKLSDRTVQDLIQKIKNLIICTKSQTGTKFRLVYTVTFQRNITFKINIDE